MKDFVHLHNHSDYSLLDGAASVDGLINKAAELGMKHLALTDHGNMFGVLKFYKSCKSKGINPIIGCEFYAAPGSRLVKSGSEKGNRYNHLILLAKDRKGYQNLMELSSKAYIEGFYYKPRIDHELLEIHNEGLICASACLGGAIPQAIMNKKQDDADELARYYNNLFGQGNFFLELQDHGIPEQKPVNEALIEMSRRLNIPLIATNDIHYIEKNHANAQDIMICIGTNRKKNEQGRMKFDSQEFYFKTQDEMWDLFGYVPEALENTVKIGEMCNLDMELPGPLLPEYEIPEEFADQDDYMRHLVYEGCKWRYNEMNEEIKTRADYELGIIINMGFTGYFLIVWDYINYARQNGIAVGPGRGSGAGSLVAYAMGITDIDPLEFNLLFERFLNPERVSMPDFDIDFCFERRDEVIDYVINKYGGERVGAICTFGTLKTKAALKDVARVLDIPFAESNAISKAVPEGKTADGRKIKVPVALEVDEELQNWNKRGGIYSELFETATVLEDMNRHVSTHACGRVIGQSKLTDYVPLYKDPKTGQINTAFPAEQLEECGLVKMDFLGLKTLTLIKNTEKLIWKTNPDFKEEEIPEYDEKTFQMLGDGKSSAVFQFESSGMQNILKRAKPNNIEDLIALNALYRPGPMQFIDQFIDSKWGRIPIEYPHPTLEEILKPTYGVIVYQEQVMQVAQIIGGFSLGKADILRRAMGKKKVKEMDRMQIEFVAGAKEKGINEKKATEIFELLIPFAGYGFNKSHAAAYSVVAYKTAFLKANYPAEFMAANLTNEINSPDAFAMYLAETREMGLEILPPSINLSEKNFTVVDGKIFYGLHGIKNVGAAAVDEIIRVREEKGDFTSFIDFLNKVDMKTVNRKVLETLIQAGLLDGMGENRATLMHNLERLLEFIGNKKDALKFGQVSLFSGEQQDEIDHFEMEQIEEWEKKEILQHEKELLGNYFSGHPLDKYRPIWNKCTNLDLRTAEKANPDKEYTILGMIKTIRQIITKKGKPMGFALLEDLETSIELVFFPNSWEKFRHYIIEDTVVGIQGKVENSRDIPKILVDKVLMPEELTESIPKEVHIRLHTPKCNEEELYNFRSFLFDYQGACQVYLHLLHPKNEKEVVIKASKQLTLNHTPETLDIIKDYPMVEAAWSE